MKRNIGKDLSKVSMPVVLNEPIGIRLLDYVYCSAMCCALTFLSFVLLVVGLVLRLCDRESRTLF